MLSFLIFWRPFLLGAICATLAALLICAIAFRGGE